MAALQQPYLTPEQYLEIERTAAFKSDYISGQIVARAAVSPEHALIAANLAGCLGTLLDSSPCRVYSSDLKVAIEATNMFAYPDVTVGCEHPEFYGGTRDALTNPTLIVEVISPSTEAYDRGEKAAHYRRSSTLREYLLVSQTSAAIERHYRNELGIWQIDDAAGLDATMELSSVGVTLRLRDVYSKVEFPANPQPLNSS